MTLYDPYEEEYASYRSAQAGHNSARSRIMASMYMDPSDPDYPDVPDDFDADEALKQIEECF
jgi:hypothetical protein